MTNFAVVVGLPFLAALACSLLGRRRRTAALTAMATFGVDLWLLLSTWGPIVREGGVARVHAPWVPQIGLNLAFLADGLGVLMASIITGIGFLVCFYAYYYLDPAEPAGRFFAWVLAFGGAMVGITLADNLLLLFFFWELTSLTSFFLIGWWHTEAPGRRGAIHALVVTAGGGLCLMAGLVLLSQAGGSYEVSQLIPKAPEIRASMAYLPALLLILLGAFTKSAQFPFQFWLPGAMAAPTPISTYLHSATMVKAGVFLVARLFPVLAGTEPWFFLLTTVGITTMVVGSFNALLVWDLKQILAYSTISQLGLLIADFGLSSLLGVSAGLFQILNHALYKSSLFMLVGFVDHLTGTRDIRRLGQLARKSRLAAFAMALAALSLAGVPPFAGFLGKEYFLTSLIEVCRSHGGGWHFWVWSLPFLAAFAGACNLAYAAKIAYGIFWCPARIAGIPRDEAPGPSEDPSPFDTSHHEPEGDGDDHHDHHHAHPGMLVPPVLLSLACLALGVYPAILNDWIFPLDLHGTTVSAPHAEFAIWHHLDWAFALSVVVFIGGPFLYIHRREVLTWGHSTIGRLDGARALDLVLDGTLDVAGRATAAVHNGRLDRYLAWTVTVLFGTTACLTLPSLTWPAWKGAFPSVISQNILWGFLAVTAVGTALVRKNFGAMIVLGLAGVIVCVLLILFRAPDLALTQLLVETATLVLLLTVVRILPRVTPHPPLNRRWRVPFSLFGGLAAAVMAWSIRIPDGAPSDLVNYYMAASLEQAGANNVVNAILVDFRGFDTMGEVTVLVAALLCILGLWAPFQFGREDAEAQGEVHSTSVILAVVSPLVTGFVLVFGLYLMLRGHHHPGGGFIGALVLVAGVFLTSMTFGPKPTSRALRLEPASLAGLGLLVSAGTGFCSLLVGWAFLTHTKFHAHIPLAGNLHIPSAAIFDGGIFFIVIGVSTVLLAALTRGDETRPGRSDW